MKNSKGYPKTGGRIPRRFRRRDAALVVEKRRTDGAYAIIAVRELLDTATLRMTSTVRFDDDRPDVVLVQTLRRA